MNTKGVNFQPSKRGQFSAAVDTSGPFPGKAILDTRVLIAEDLGAARDPWCSRR